MSVKILEPANTGIDIGENVACGLLGSRDHHNRQTQAARGLYLGIGRGAARVLGDEHFDALGRQKPCLCLGVEGAAVGKEADARRERHITRRVDGAGEVVMLRRRSEGWKLEASRGQEHAPRRVSQGGSRFFGRRDEGPAVAAPGLPGGAPEGAEGDAYNACRGDGIGRDVNREWMCRVDHGLDLLLSQPGREAFAAAEAAGAARDRLGERYAGAAGERKGRLEAPVVRNAAREFACFGGAA